MYKKKLSSWNAFKNLRLDEVLQILYLKKHRDAAQKASVFFIRNREVDYSNLQVYLSRNPSVFARLEAGATPSPEAIRDVTCRTPPTSPVTLISGRFSPLPVCPAPLVLCNRLLPVSEDLFRAIRIHLDLCFNTGLWSWSDSSCWNTRGQYGPSALLSSVIDRCITAGLSISRQVEPVAVRRALDPPFAMLIRVFRNPPPLLIPKLLSAALHLARIGRREIQILLLQFCRDIARAIFGPHHPLAKFWESLVAIPHPEQQDAIERILVLCTSEYDKRLGPTHPLTMEAYLQYFDAIVREKDPEEQLQSLQHQLEKVDSRVTDGPLLGLLKLEHTLATCKVKLGQQLLDEAEEVLSRFESSLITAREESFRYVWLGYVQCIKGDFSAAEQSYKNSVLAARQTGSRDCVLEALFQLETFFLHAGKPLAAEKVRTERFHVLHRLATLAWVDQENAISSESSSSRPTVTIIRIGSGESSDTWRPSAFTETADHVEGLDFVS